MEAQAIRRLIVLALVALLAGCYARGMSFDEAPRPAPDQAVVYFYRVPGSFASMVTVAIFIDGKRVGSLGQEGFTWVRVEPGRHEFGATFASFQSGPPSLRINGTLRGGDQVYLRLYTEPIPGGTRIGMRPMARAEAEAEMKTYKYEKPSE